MQIGILNCRGIFVAQTVPLSEPISPRSMFTSEYVIVIIGKLNPEFKLTFDLAARGHECIGSLATLVCSAEKEIGTKGFFAAVYTCL